MPLEFRSPICPSTIDELSEIQREQLYCVGKAFDGIERSAADRLRDIPLPENYEWDWDDGNLAAHGLIYYAAWDGDRHVYDVWVHHSSDNGCLFTSGTTELIAGRYQDTWMAGDETSPLDEALQDAEAAFNEDEDED